MPKRPSCYKKFMENIGNPNCDNCWCAAGCYIGWNENNKGDKQIDEAVAKNAPLSKFFSKEELCIGKCEREEKK